MLKPIDYCRMYEDFVRKMSERDAEHAADASCSENGISDTEENIK